MSEQPPPSLRARLRSLRRSLWFLRQLRLLPRPVAAFQWRAWRLAMRTGETFGPLSATRPRKLATLLRLAEGRQRVVELGTAAAWTTVALALSDPGRTVISYDVHERPIVEAYLGLAGPDVRRRIELVHAPGADGPASAGAGVDLLYIDSSHEREETIRELRAWSAVLRPGALVVFDDYGHPAYPGVAEAVRELGLEGRARDGLFVHRVPGGA